MTALSGARKALVLLLAINLFNYIDRYVLAAVERRIGEEFFPDRTAGVMEKMGWLGTAFLVSYMVAAPLLGWLADRMSKWLLVGLGVVVWSLASGCSGLAGSFAVMLVTRACVGIGEAAYGPAAPTIISDYYPVRRRGSVLAWFYMAIPVGSALGYALGGFVAERWGWRVAFYVVVPPGLALGIWALLMREPPSGISDSAAKHKAMLRDYLLILRTPSYLLDTAGMTAMTFAIGGIAFWMPRYLYQYRHAGTEERTNTIFGALLAVAGITATLAGGMAGDKLRERFPGSYFLVSAAGIFIACPLVLAMMWIDFPYAWAPLFGALFFLFFSTGPSNTILANVTHPSVRASAFALNIFIIHALGDAVSPPLLGKVVGPVPGPGGLVYHWNAAFYAVVCVMVLAGVLWMLGARYLKHDTAAAPKRIRSKN